MPFHVLSKHLWKENLERKKKIADFSQDFLYVMHLIPVSWFGFLNTSATVCVSTICSIL